MSKQEEIEDSLEFCRDIYLYYDAIDSKNSTAMGNWKSKLSNQSRTLETEQKLLNSGEIEEEAEAFMSVWNWILQEAFFFFLCVVFSVVVAKLLSIYVVQQTIVNGYSMENALEDGDHVILNKLSYRLKEPERFDIIVFPYEEDVYYVKRIIGLPGEKVQMLNGTIYINGKVLEEDYGIETFLSGGLAENEITLAQDEYFVLGDNRNHSLDSRYQQVGLISKEKLLGKAMLRIYPLNRMKWMYGE